MTHARQTSRSLVLMVGLLFTVSAVGAFASLSALLGPALAVGVGASVGGGGLLIAAGGVWLGVEHVGRAVERAGHYVAAAGWLSYAVAFATVSGLPESVLPVLQAAVVLYGGLARANALRRIDRAVERAAADRECRGST